MSRKIIIEDGRDPLVWELGSEPCLIGRDASCDVVLECDRASRKHLRVTLSGDDLIVEDLGSSNGTLLNGEPLHGKAIAHRGDVLRIGSAAIHVDADPVPVAASFGEAPPATRRAAADRRSTNNTPLVLIAAMTVLGLIAWSQWPDAAAPEEADASRRDDAGEVADADDPRGGAAPTVDPEEVRQRKARARSVSNLSIEIEELIVQDAFADAIAAVAAHEERWGGTRRTQRMRISEAMDAASIRIRTDYHRLIAQGRADVARALVRDALPSFPEGAQVRSALTLLTEAPTSSPDVVTAENDSPRKPTSGTDSPTSTDVSAATATAPRPAASTSAREEAERRFFGGNEAAEQLFNARDYAAAATAYDELVTLGRRGDVDIDLVEIVRGKARVAHNLAAFRAVLERVADEQPQNLTAIPYMPGARGDVVGKGEHGIVFSANGSELDVGWRALREEALIAIVGKAELDGADAVNAAAFLFAANRAKDAEKLITRAYKADAGVKPEVDRVLAGARGIEIPQGGFLHHDGAWVTPNELDRIKVRETVVACLGDLQHADAAIRVETYTKLKALGPRAHSAFHRALVECKEKLLAKMATYGGFKKAVEIAAQHELLVETRDHALDLIFDTEKYPYPYRGRGQEVLQQYQETQREVDVRVAAVREIWKANPEARLSSELILAVGVLREYDEQLYEIDLGLGPKAPSFLMHLPANNNVLTLRTFATDEVQRAEIDTSLAWMAENAAVQSTSSRAERDQVRVTNEYRLMMGRHAVKIHEKLLAAARGHSDDMVKLGFFSHTNDLNPKKRTPRDRVLLAGFAGVGVSENIAINSGGAQGAHNAWIHSSGHHRNILAKAWRLLGSGNSGSYWTQNFSIREYTDEEREARGLSLDGGDGTPEDGGPDE